MQSRCSRLVSFHQAAACEYNDDDVANMQRVEDHNALNLGSDLGEDQFSEYTLEQYQVAAGLGYTLFQEGPEFG